MKIVDLPALLPAVSGPKGQPPGETTDFASMLAEQLTKVNELQLQADNLTQQFVAGQTENLHDVHIAVEKANLALQLTVEVRNKVIEAYQEVSRMQI